MKENRFRKVIARGDAVVGLMVQEFGTRGLAKVLEATDIDFVVLDMEHSGWGIDRIADLVAWLKATDITPLVRVPATQHGLIPALLDSGAMGIQVADVQDPAFAKQVVAAVKYPPLGHRGLGLNSAHTDYLSRKADDYMPLANASTLVVAQIESLQGLENIDAIAAVEGLDVVSISHSDLTQALGIHGQTSHPRYVAAAQAIADAARRHNKVAKVHPHSNEEMERYAAMGYRMFMADNEMVHLRNSLKASVSNLRKHTRIGIETSR